MKQTRRTIIAALLAFVSLASFQILLRAGPEEAQIKDIRARYNAIEGAKLPSKKIEFETQDEPLFGTCTLYSKGTEVVKIHLSQGAGDHCASDEYFYYDDGTLFFAYASDGIWQFTGETLANGESETVDMVTEHRVYFAGDKTVRHLTKKVSSKKPDHLAGLLAKAANVPSHDPDRAATLLAHGKAAYTVKSPADLGRLLTASE